MQILLNPSIDTSKVAHGRPVEAQTRSTFVIDLTSLKHPDDVKKRCMVDGTTAVLTPKCFDAHSMNLMIYILRSVLQVLPVPMCIIYAVSGAVIRTAVNSVVSSHLFMVSD